MTLAPETIPVNQASPIDFYFDVISPFGYFASLRIDALAAKYGRTVNWRPILIGVSILKVMGLPPMLEIPLKGEYIVREAERYARRYELKLGRSIRQQPGNPLGVMRPFAWLVDNKPETAKDFARACLDGYWREGTEITSAEEVARLGGLSNLDGKELQLATESGSVNLRRQVDEAIARGVFGSPFFIVDGEPFFGLNSMEMLESWLRDGRW